MWSEKREEMVEKRKIDNALDNDIKKAAEYEKNVFPCLEKTLKNFR